MDYKKFLFTIFILTIAHAASWFQFYGHVRWRIFQSLWMVVLIGIPVSLLYFYSTKIGIQAFGGETWPVRLLQFVCGIAVFSFMSGYFMGEALSTKNLVSLSLCLIIILLQLFWK